MTTVRPNLTLLWPSYTLFPLAGLGILVFGDTKLTGERLYASEELYRMMVGPVYDEAVPV